MDPVGRANILSRADCKDTGRRAKRYLGVRAAMGSTRETLKSHKLVYGGNPPK